MESGSGTAMLIAGSQGRGAMATQQPRAGNLGELQAAVQAMGKFIADAQVGGAKTTPQGMVIAWACMSRGLDPFQFAARYHLIDGKCQLQAHVILARMQEIGVKIKWVNLGQDGVEARAEFTAPDGTAFPPIFYTMEQAKKAGVVRKDSAWEKYPGQMLRASVIREAVKLICPRVLDDDTDPVEFDAATADDKPTKPRVGATVATSVAPVTTPSLSAPQPPAEVVIETTVEKIEQPPFVTDEAKVDTVREALGEIGIRHELRELLGRLGATVDAYIANVKKAKPEITGETLDEIPDAVIEQSIAKLKEKLAPKS